jgi:hypothetical protein
MRYIGGSALALIPPSFDVRRSNWCCQESLFLEIEKCDVNGMSKVRRRSVNKVTASVSCLAMPSQLEEPPD